MHRLLTMAAAALLGAWLPCCKGSGERSAASDGVDRSQVWQVTGTTRDGVDLLVRGARVDAIKGDLEALIKAFNRVTVQSLEKVADGEGPGAPVLWLREVRNGVARVEVADADFLTRKMGTTGAHYYLTAATFTLTEAPGIRAVDFAFEEGDHAAPGIYTRESFKDVTIISKGATP